MIRNSSPLGQGDSRERSGSKRFKKNNMYHRQQGRRGGRGQGSSHNGGFGGPKRERETLVAGIKGFIVTMNPGRERDCVKEVYNILNEYYEPNTSEQGDPNQPGTSASGQSAASETEVEDKSNNSDDLDIAEALAAEVRELKSASVAHRFQSMDMGVKCMAFIKTNIDDPTGLCWKIFNDVFEKKVVKARFLLRMLPIEVTCPANIDAVKSEVEALTMKYMSQGVQSFKIEFNSRFTQKLVRNETIAALAEAIGKVNPLSVVNLTEPNFTFLVEVTKNVCCLGVVRDFVKFRKYNLGEAGNTQRKQEDDAQKGENAAVDTEGPPKAADTALTFKQVTIEIEKEKSKADDLEELGGERSLLDTFMEKMSQPD